MNRRVLKIALLAAAVYVFALLALFPASLAVRWLVPAVPGLVLGPASGSVWNGRISSVGYAGWNAGAAEWNTHPLSLLGLAIAADVRIDRDEAAPLFASVHAGFGGGVEISDLRGGLAIAELEHAGLVPRNIASGNLILDIARLEIASGKPVAAEGRVGLTDLASTLLPGVALGVYEGELETTDAGIRAVFRDVEAPLRVTGEAQLQRDGRYTVTGSITPNGETPEPLRRGLALLGQPDASGAYRFSFSGQL